MMESLVIYIKKLNHPIKEIRERSLKLLLTKVQYGWELQDELGSTRDLIDNLLTWLNEDQPLLQKDALMLLLIAIKTKGGAYIVKEFGIKNILSNLNKLKNKINEDASEVFDDVVETLRFLNTVDSEITLGIPPLKLNSVVSSKTSQNESSCYEFNCQRQQEQGLLEEPVNNEMEKSKKAKTHTSAVKCLLFPWVHLGLSDIKTINLIKDSLKLLKSTRRCCRFVRDVFVRDFPAQIFLNRPAIIKTLLAISDGRCGGHPDEALCVLLCMTQALYKQLLQLFSLDLICESKKILGSKEDIEDKINMELEKTVEIQKDSPQHDALLVLRQLPLPIFALDTMQAVFTIMSRSMVADNFDKTGEFNMKKANTCLCLIDSLVKILLESVSERFWQVEHNSKTYRDIAHKTCITMRMLGDLLMKYSKLFEDSPESVYYRIAWLRLVPCAVQLLYWARESPLPPTLLVSALQQAQIDPALDLLYRKISKEITNVLLVAKSSKDKEHKSKHSELIKLYDSIDQAIKFKILRLSTRNVEKLLACIQKTLPIFHFNPDKSYFKEIVMVLFDIAKDLDSSDKEWSLLCEIVLKLMAHSEDWIRVTFYKLLTEFIRTAFMGDDSKQAENEKCLALLCHVEILTEICCQGLSSEIEEVEASASEMMVYLLRGRLVLSDGCWWRLLATLQPVFPLLHVYAAHDTPLGKAICKSLEAEIAACMGVSEAERWRGLARALFVRCDAVRVDAARELCRLLDDKKYLPPRESLRADVLMSALERVEPQNFNVEESISPSTSPQTTGLVQVLEVLKQDLSLEESGTYTCREGVSSAALEPALRRSTLQQLAMMLRHRETHDTFAQHNGLNLVISLLRMSLMVDDYLAFPECAISCVSILNSIGFENRHTLTGIKDLPLLLLRVMLVFPANESSVRVSAQVLALCCWAGFVLRELAEGAYVPALPRAVVHRACLPFPVLAYWNTSPNTGHSRIDWLLTDDSWRNAVLFRWWWASAGGAASVRAGFASGSPGSAALTGTPRDSALRSDPGCSAPMGAAAAAASCLTAACAKALLALENATSHEQVIQALQLLQSYLPLCAHSPGGVGGLPWVRTGRFLRAPPASPRDAHLLSALLHCVITYIDHVPNRDNSMAWIKASFIGNDAAVISLLSRDQLYPNQTALDEIELAQLRILIVKVLVRCIVLVEQDGDYSCSKMESLIKILLASLEMIDLKNFHVLGYLNELMRCVRYAVHSRHCELSENTLIQCLRTATRTLGGCAAGSGRKGHACRLDATLAMLALVRQARQQAVPVQRWSEWFDAATMRVLVGDCDAARTELRAAALHTVAALAQHAQLLPQIIQCVPSGSLIEFAVEAFCRSGEANVVRAAAAALITAVTARCSPQSQISENEIMQTIAKSRFTEECLNILIDFSNTKDYEVLIEPNVPLSVFDREAEMEVRAEKCDMQFSPTSNFHKPPPTPMVVSAVADVINNISTLKSVDVKTWNEQGLYRILFRCASWLGGESSEVSGVRAASCRALVAAASHRCVRIALAQTVDCLHDFLAIFTCSDSAKNPVECDMGLSALTQSLLLLAMLLQERSAYDTVWFELRKEQSMPFFLLLLESLKNENAELQDAAMYCLSVLTRSMSHKPDVCSMEFFDDLKSPSGQQISDRLSAGDGEDFEDCQPDYMAESYCKILMKLYHRYTDCNPCYSSQDERWRRASACLSSLLCASARARAYGAHRRLPRALAGTLQRVRDALSLQGKSADVIKNTNNDPILETLHWILTLMSCSVVECGVAKESFADEHVETSLVRLWPWCMMTEALRMELLRLLVNFTNDCTKAWARMCACVSGRSVVGEACALATREAARVRSSALLPLALRVLTHCTPHHHCRSIIIKSEVVCSAVRACTRGCAAGAALCAALARHPDGAGALLGARGTAPPRRLLPALAHAAHHQRQACLQSPDILELLSNALIAGDVSEVVSAARAVWALAANNHRAKLILRNSGMVSAVQAAVQRLQRLDGDAERALQLLNYTHTVLQAS